MEKMFWIFLLIGTFLNAYSIDSWDGSQVLPT